VNTGRRRRRRTALIFMPHNKLSWRVDLTRVFHTTHMQNTQDESVKNPHSQSQTNTAIVKLLPKFYYSP